MFAGVGGFSLGLDRTGGFETVAVAELDPYASRVLRLRFPDAPNIGDVTTAEYPDADVICAGFPCQDISFAGAGAGLAGARSGLFWQVVRAISVVRPKYVILENVAALLSRGLDDVLGALAEVGYDTEWHCIPASAVGAPHRRDRIWIIAHPRGEQHEGDRAPISGEIAAELSRAAAHAQGDGQSFGGAGDEGLHASEACGIGLWAEPSRDGAGDGTGPLADAKCPPDGRRRVQGPREDCKAVGAGTAEKSVGSCAHVADSGILDVEGIKSGVADPQKREGSVERPSGPCGDGLGWWAVEPDVGRVANGIPKRVDRLRCLGNAVVPQIPELIGNAILAAHREAHSC